MLSKDGRGRPRPRTTPCWPARLAAGDRFSHALVTLDAVAVLPEELVPEGAIEAARAYLEELRADALIARLDMAETSAVRGGDAARQKA